MTITTPDHDTVRLLPGIIVGTLIAIIAFILSFDALRILFIDCGLDPRLAWGGPLCVDGIIILTTWAVWGFRKARLRHRWYPWMGFLLSGLLSVAGNALHAWTTTGASLPQWIPPMVMAVPPVALMYATHLIVIIAGDRHDRRRVAATADPMPEPSTPTQPTLHKHVSDRPAPTSDKGDGWRMLPLDL